MCATAAPKWGKQLRMAWVSWHSTVERTTGLSVQVLSSARSQASLLSLSRSLFHIPKHYIPISAVFFPFSNVSPITYTNWPSLFSEIRKWNLSGIRASPPPSSRVEFILGLGDTPQLQHRAFKTYGGPCKASAAIQLEAFKSLKYPEMIGNWMLSLPTSWAPS